MDVVADTIHNDGYSTIYMTFDFPEQKMYSKKIWRYILDDDYCLWDICARLSNSTPILHYYIIAKTLRNAKAKYIDKLPYMRVLSITIAEENEARYILNHPGRFCIW